jgi:hypothetical protein
MGDDDNYDYANYYQEGNVSYVCTSWAPILGFMGIASAVVFASKCDRSIEGCVDCPRLSPTSVHDKQYAHS